jgi:hypothetical protein
MEMNQIEFKKVDEVSTEATDLAVQALTDLQLAVVGGGGAIAQFG